MQKKPIQQYFMDEIFHVTCNNYILLIAKGKVLLRAKKYHSAYLYLHKAFKIKPTSIAAYFLSKLELNDIIDRDPLDAKQKSAQWLKVAVNKDPWNFKYVSKYVKQIKQFEGKIKMVQNHHDEYIASQFLTMREISDAKYNGKYYKNTWFNETENHFERCLYLALTYSDGKDPNIKQKWIKRFKKLAFEFGTYLESKINYEYGWIREQKCCFWYFMSDPKDFSHFHQRRPNALKINSKYSKWVKNEINIKTIKKHIIKYGIPECIINIIIKQLFVQKIDKIINKPAFALYV